MVVDSQGVDPPSDKWLRAAQEAADTDGICDGARTRKLYSCYVPSARRCAASIHDALVKV